MMLGNEADSVCGPWWHETHTNTVTYILPHTISLFHTQKHRRSRSPSTRDLKTLINNCAGSLSITLHILSEDPWGICAYSHNRHTSPDTHTCPGLKAVTHTVPCDVSCIIWNITKELNRYKWYWMFSCFHGRAEESRKRHPYVFNSFFF